MLEIVKNSNYHLVRESEIVGCLFLVFFPYIYIPLNKQYDFWL